MLHANVELEGGLFFCVLEWFFFSEASLIFAQYNLDYNCSKKWKARLTKSWLQQSMPLVRPEVLNLQSFWSRALAVTVQKQLKLMSFIKTVNLFELLCLQLPARLLSNI